MAKHKHGAQVSYAHGGKVRRAQITEVHPETGEVQGLAVYALNELGEHSGAIEFGVPMPKEATEAAHRSIDGHFWVQ